MTPVTAIVPAKNEAANLRACLEGLRWADEIILADSGSTDETMAIAREFGARVIEREYVNYMDFCNWAITHATHEWVFLLDADERVTPELQSEIQALREKGLADGPDVYAVGRRNFFLGQEIRYCGWDTDSVNRLFQRDRCRYPDLSVHGNLDLVGEWAERGRRARLTHKLLHYSYPTLEHYLSKFDSYTTYSAENLLRKGLRKASLGQLFLRPVGRFFKMYLLRLGFLDGKAGLILCLLAAFSVHMKYAKLWAICEAPNKQPLNPRTTLPEPLIAEIARLQKG